MAFFILWDRLGVKFGLSKFFPFLSTQPYAKSGGSVKLIGVDNFFVSIFLFNYKPTQNFHQVELTPKVVHYDRLLGAEGLFAYSDLFHKMAISFFQFLIRHHRIDGCALHRSVAEDVHHIGT